MTRGVPRSSVDRRALISTLALFPVLSSLASVSASAQTAASSGALPSWNEGPARIQRPPVGRLVLTSTRLVLAWTCCLPCNCNHGFSRSRYPQQVRSRGPRSLPRPPQNPATNCEGPPSFNGPRRFVVAAKADIGLNRARPVDLERMRYTKSNRRLEKTRSRLCSPSPGRATSMASAWRTIDVWRGVADWTKAQYPKGQ
jgi:hypothetical protein